MKTDFVVTLTGCDDNAAGFPLSYEYKLVDASTGKKRSLANTPLLDSSVSRKLEEGENNLLLVFIKCEWSAAMLFCCIVSCI